jgi:hypothetical protein
MGLALLGVIGLALKPVFHHPARLVWVLGQPFE